MTSRARNLANLASDGVINTAEIADGAITTPKIADGAVVTIDIANGAVTIPKLAATGTPGATNYLRGDNTWATITAGFSGGTVTSSATDITLTSASPQLQVVEMTASGRFIVLPNATTLTKGGFVFIIRNNGVNPFGIKDGAGNILISNLNYYQSVQLELADNSTVAGSWDVPFSVLQTLTTNQAVTGTRSFAWLSASSFVYAYRDTGGLYWARAGTISGSTVTLGTLTQLTSNPTGVETLLGVFPVSSTTAVFAVGVNDGGSVTAQARALNISGTTITFGTYVTIDSNTASFQQQIKYIQLDPATNKGLFFSGSSVTGVPVRARAFTVSGTTITQGALADVPNSAATYLYEAERLSASTVVYGVASRLGVASVSGTTVTFGTQTSNIYPITNETFSKRSLPISSTQAILETYFITVSGTSISTVSSTNEPNTSNMNVSNVIVGVNSANRYDLRKYASGNLSPRAYSETDLITSNLITNGGWNTQQQAELFSPVVSGTAYLACAVSNSLSFVQIKVNV